MRGRALREVAGSSLTGAGRAALGALLGLSASTAVAHASAVGVLLILARALEPTRFGQLSFALTAQGYLVLLGSLACGSVVIREGVRRPGDLDAITTSFFGLTATSSVVSCAAVLVTIGMAPVSSEERWLLTFVAIGTVAASMSPQALFDAHHRQARGGMVTAAAEVTALLAVLALWRGGALGLPAVGAVYAAKWGLASTGQALVYHLTVRRLRWRRSSAEWRLLLRSSWPILFASMLFFVPLSSGVVLVRLRGGPDEAALFGLAYQVASAYHIFAALGVQVVQPHIYGVHGLDRGFLARLAVSATVFLGGAAVLAFAGGWAVVRLALPPFYRAAVPVMPWLLAAAALLALGRILSAYLLRFDDGPFILAAHLASALLYVAACLLLPAPWIRPGAAVLAPCAVLAASGACAWKVRARIREASSP
jgi:O-antigen/teichoic acid export membrane protein